MKRSLKKIAVFLGEAIVKSVCGELNKLYFPHPPED